ncbi:hydrophobin 2 [Mycena metata]|uniref:Hydrophobin n=1 Tax=Mycena metata TaxID=1033252 RepID=A0AAD7HX84_9AGAR|nr:hydrophobin 2 [Mycena metata]
MFFKLSVVVASTLITLAAAIPNGTPPPPVTPPTIPECCASVISSTSPPFVSLAAVLGIDITGLPDIPIGLSCSPITALPADCGNITVICDLPEAAWGGLIALNCLPVTL